MTINLTVDLAYWGNMLLNCGLTALFMLVMIVVAAGIDEWRWNRKRRKQS